MNYDYYWLLNKYPDGIDFSDFLDEYLNNRETIEFLKTLRLEEFVESKEISSETRRDLKLYRKRRDYMKELMKRFFNYGFSEIELKAVCRLQEKVDNGDKNVYMLKDVK